MALVVTHHDLAPGASASHAGSVHFVPEGSGTHIDVSLQSDPPGGAIAQEGRGADGH